MELDTLWRSERRHDGSLDYTYDNRYRLTEVRENGQVTEAYSYDANGNRTNITSVHRGITQQPASYATGDQLQSQGNTVVAYGASSIYILYAPACGCSLVALSDPFVYISASLSANWPIRRGAELM